jgi:hypothetical protein
MIPPLVCVACEEGFHADDTVLSTMKCSCPCHRTNVRVLPAPKPADPTPAEEEVLRVAA